MDEASKQYTTFTVENLGFFECKHMPFGLCNSPATFQRLMQNCLGELNLTYYLIHLDVVIVFLKMEHLQCLCVVLDHFQEHNLRLKPTKCKVFQDEINCLAHHVSKEGIWLKKVNLKAVAEFVPPQTYTEIQAFLGLVGHYWQFIKGFAYIAQPLHEHLFGEDVHKKEWVSNTQSGGQGHLWDS